jgi:tetratricopeptide (TPR) repeat protein
MSELQPPPPEVQQERLEKWIRGELTLQQLNEIPDADMGTITAAAYTLYQKGQHDEAMVLFRGLAALNPKDAYYRLAMGSILMEKQELERAVECFTSAIMLDDECLEAHVSRGEAYLRTGKVVEGAQDLVRAVELDPEGKNPMTARARLIAEATLKQIQDTEGGASSESAQSANKAAKPAATKKPGKKA